MNRYTQKSILFLLVLLIWQLPVSVRAGVSARYQPSGDRAVRIRLVLTPPVPKAVIVLQRMPMGAGIVMIAPEPVGVNRQNGVVRWLFRHPQPGSIDIVVRLNTAWQAGGGSGRILFRRPSGGEVVKPITPPVPAGEVVMPLPGAPPPGIIQAPRLPPPRLPRRRPRRRR